MKNMKHQNKFDNEKEGEICGDEKVYEIESGDTNDTGTETEIGTKVDNEVDNEKSCDETGRESEKEKEKVKKTW
jgi:hypothetical protein